MTVHTYEYQYDQRGNRTQKWEPVSDRLTTCAYDVQRDPSTPLDPNFPTWDNQLLRISGSAFCLPP